MILAMTGGKGGVGKSTLAYNVGAALDAVVVDADLGMADLPRGHGPDLHDVLAGRAAPREAVRPGPVDLLPCGRSLAGARAADVGRLDDVVRSVAPARDVVIDCPAGLRVDAGVPLAVADACIVVASPRAWALADAVSARELARELEAGVVAVALNRVLDEVPTGAVGRVLGAPAVSIPADPRLGRSVGTESPVVDAAPDDAATRAVEELAAAVQSCKSP